MLRWLTAGESHGPALVAVLEGLPAGVHVTSKDVQAALARRRLGYGRGARMNFEADELEIIGGIRHGVTLGSPIALRIGNSEWPKWETVMAADPVDPDVLASQKRGEPLTRPRPGHADLAGMQKYGFEDARPILERASARETAARVALGEVAAQFLEQTVGATIVSHVIELGSVKAPAGVIPAKSDIEALDADPVRCFDPETSTAMVAEIDQAHKDGDTLGGVVEVVVEGLPPGLGSHTHWDRRLDSKLAGALMGIQAIKGVEVGDGFELARTRGSLAHDEIVLAEAGAPMSVKRVSGRSGGTEGGMTTGEILRVRAAMKPIATVPRALRTVDVATGEATAAHHQRSDVCAVPAAGIVAEAMVALVLAEAVLDKFGGDSVAETKRNYEGYLANLRVR
ncbi:MAG TPA: chorismate synthase [Aeromicrobium sp.]|nr:chorismate synthase [Aeromicrobium sp.]